jgi:polysaccharide deacetylase family protein (PEP-CTERM system associated)
VLPPSAASRAAADAAVARTMNAMTIDVEDYFHVSVFERTVPRTSWDGLQSRVRANTDRLLDMFDEHGVRGTFFVLGLVAERDPGLIRAIASRGHELASHGYAHRLVYDQTPEVFREDVRRAKALIEDTSGRQVRGYRAPSFSVTEKSLWALDVLLEEGYRYDASIFPIRHDRYGIPDAPRWPHAMTRPAGRLFEVPGSTVRIGGTNLPVAGGAYFRILPYAWTRWGMTRVNQVERQPAVFYLHPWEIDPDQPRLPASAFGRFRHYRNLHRTEKRLRALMRDFAFGPLEAVLACCAARACPLPSRGDRRHPRRSPSAPTCRSPRSTAGCRRIRDRPATTSRDGGG